MASLFLFYPRFPSSIFLSNSSFIAWWDLETIFCLTVCSHSFSYNSLPKKKSFPLVWREFKICRWIVNVGKTVSKFDFHLHLTFYWNSWLGSNFFKSFLSRKQFFTLLEALVKDIKKIQVVKSWEILWHGLYIGESFFSFFEIKFILAPNVDVRFRLSCARVYCIYCHPLFHVIENCNFSGFPSLDTFITNRCTCLHSSKNSFRFCFERKVFFSNKILENHTKKKHHSGMTFIKYWRNRSTDDKRQSVWNFTLDNKLSFQTN